MHKAISLLFLIIISLSFISCQPQQLVEPTLTITDTIIPSSTLTDTPKPQSTRTKIPTLTISNTPNPTNTLALSSKANGATLTAIPRQKTFQADYDLYSTQMSRSYDIVPKTLEAKGANCPTYFHYAPYYGQYMDADNYITNKDVWTIINCMPNYDNEIEDKGFTRVYSYDNSKIWTISYEVLDLYDSFYLNAIYIDSNGEFIYFTPKVDGDVDGFFEESYFGSGSPIFQLDLQTGDVATITRLTNDFEYFDMVFSPDAETIILATSKHPHTIQFMHTMNGQIYQTVELNSEITRIGSFVWTKDQKYLIYMAGHDGWETVKNGISIYRLDLDTLENVAIVQNDMRMMVPISYADYPYSWIEGDILFLKSIHYMNFFSGYEFFHWQLDILTGEITDLGEDYYWY
ncbi:MAG: hypothetical protein JEZ00_15845 [Anaerolineaceae bacterium]|nr:hypothetical protein [Anaerolineaceae bacterium]